MPSKSATRPPQWPFGVRLNPKNLAALFCWLTGFAVAVAGCGTGRDPGGERQNTPDSADLSSPSSLALRGGSSITRPPEGGGPGGGHMRGPEWPNSGLAHRPDYGPRHAGIVFPPLPFQPGNWNHHSGPWNTYPGPWNPIHNTWISYFSASPSNITRGGMVQLSWSAPGAQYVNIDGVGTNFSSFGSYMVSPQVPTTYTIWAYGYQGQQVSASAYVHVQEAPVRIVSFSANPPQIQKGEVTNIYWSVENCRQVQLLVYGDSNGAGTYGCTGNVAVSPGSQTSYSLSAVGLNGQVMQGSSVTVFVTPRPVLPAINFFRAIPATIERGQSTVLEWNVRDAANVQLFGAEQLQQPSAGRVTLSPQATTTYTLKATAANGQTTENRLTVEVVVPAPPPTIRQFDANPPSIDVGQRVTLTWNVSGCHDVFIEGLSTIRLPCIGSKAVVLSQSTNFNMTARNDRGTAVYRMVYVPAKQPPALPMIWNFTTNRPELPEGHGGATLHWETTHTTRVELRGPGVNATVPAVGVYSVSPTKTATYELTAYNERNQATRSTLSIKVRPRQKPSIDFFRSNNPIAVGGPLELSWKTNYCFYAEILGVMPKVAQTQGSFSYTPKLRTERLTFRCTGENSEILEAVVVVGMLPKNPTDAEATDALLGIMLGGKP